MGTTRKTSARAANDGETVTINVAVPVALHRKLRIRAINEDLTLSEAIAAAVKEWTR